MPSYGGPGITEEDHSDVCWGASWMTVRKLGEISEEVPEDQEGTSEVKPVLLEEILSERTKCNVLLSHSRPLHPLRIWLTPQDFQKVPKSLWEVKRTRSSQLEWPRNQLLPP